MRTVCGYIEGCIAVNSRFFVRKPRLFGDETDNVHTESVNPLFSATSSSCRKHPGVQLDCPSSDQAVLWRTGAGNTYLLSCHIPMQDREAGAPVVRKASVFLCRTPDVVISVRIVCGFAALDKPFVFIRGMVYNQVHHDFDAFFRELWQAYGRSLPWFRIRP